MAEIEINPEYNPMRDPMYCKFTICKNCKYVKPYTMFDEYFICTKKLFNKKIKSGTGKCPIGCYELCGHEF